MASAYDELGRLLSVTDAAGNLTSYTYDEAGNKLTQSDAEGRTTSWAYDALGRPISRTLPMGKPKPTAMTPTAIESATPTSMAKPIA